MAKFKKPKGPRKRLTFYLTEVQTKRLKAIQAESAELNRKVTFSDDFTTWLNHQLTQAEKGLKALRKEVAGNKGGSNG